MLQMIIYVASYLRVMGDALGDVMSWKSEHVLIRNVAKKDASRNDIVHGCGW